MDGRIQLKAILKSLECYIYSLIRKLYIKSGVNVLQGLESDLFRNKSLISKYTKTVTKEEAEELREIRKTAGLSQYKIAEYMHCKTGKIELLEKGGTRVDLDFLERLKKRYQLVIKYKNT